MSCELILREKRMKFTPQRRMIVNIIHKKADHLSAEDIIDDVQRRTPGVNKSTVYRTLELLEQSGCVFKGESADGFIYHHAPEGHHHHLVCRKCGSALECEENLFLPVEDSLSLRYGFQADFKHMVIRGVCHACLNK